MPPKKRVMRSFGNKIKPKEGGVFGERIERRSSARRREQVGLPWGLPSGKELNLSAAEFERLANPKPTQGVTKFSPPISGMKVDERIKFNERRGKGKFPARGRRKTD